MTKIAFLGLGVMGYPMAGHLANAGYDITVYNRTNSKAKKWIAKFPGNMKDTPSCLLYTSPSPRDLSTSRMPSSA